MEERIYSKGEVGSWAAEMLPESHVALVQEALAAYRGDVGEDDFAPELERLEGYAEFMTDELRRLATA